MSGEKKAFIGIDVGTQGVRLVVVDQEGNQLFSEGESLTLTERSREEQSPQEWWQACTRLLQSMRKHLEQEIKNGLTFISIGATSTSGTVIPIDKANKPLHWAIMYSDQRSAAASLKVKELAEAHFDNGKGYTNFNSSSGLSKICWFVEEFPEQAKEIKYWIHAADYIIGQLSGCFHTTDETNALKSGYDVAAKIWPSYIYKDLPIKKEWLQAVVPTGTVLGTLKKEWEDLFDLNEGIQVVTGLTDGCASQISSGAVDVGDWNSTIGTTLVIKGITSEEVIDPEGRIYSHRHPQGYWMPGGAANIGADWVNEFSATEVEEFSKEDVELLPSAYFTYPLKAQGERFPFIAPDAVGFQPDGMSRKDLFVSSMEGLAFIERYAYELIEEFSGEKVAVVYAAGGASNNDLWMKIRSNVLNLPIRKMHNVSGAMGAAIMAASQTHFSTLVEATNVMTRLEKEFKPDKPLSEKYEKRYQAFINLLKDKKYI